MKHILHITSEALCIAVLWLAGCDLFTPPVARNGGGVVEVRIGTPEGRTLYPVLDEFTKYELSFDGPGSAAHENEVITDGSADIELARGTWTIIATAYTGIGAEEKATARGSATVTVSETDPVQANITLGPITGGEVKGTFSYAISLPADASAATLTLTNTETETPVQGSPFNLLAEGGNEGSLDCDPGYYLMQVQFTHAANESGGVTVVVHIYPSLTTSAVYDLTRPFVAVSRIDLAQTSTIAGNDFVIAGRVRPSYASHKTVVWTLKSAGTSGAALNGNVLTTTGEGSAVITASVADGLELGTPWTQDFTIAVIGSEAIGGSNPHLAALANLGISSVAKRVDPMGNELPDDYSPLGNTAVLHPLREIFIAGYDSNITSLPISIPFYLNTFAFLNDIQNSSLSDSLFTPLASSRDMSPGSLQTGSANRYKKAVSGNFAGDGREEAMVVYFDQDTQKITPSIYAPNASFITETIRTPATYSGTISDLAAAVRDRWSVAAGDMDGDGLDELIVAFMDTVYLWNGSGSGPVTLGVSCSYPQVAMADYDQDGLMEWVLADGSGNSRGTVTWKIYDDLTHGGGTTLIASGTLSEYSAAAQVAIGDFDGDGLPDTVFSGLDYFWILNTKMNSQSRPVFSLGRTVYSYHMGTTQTPPTFFPVAVGDMDGNGIDDIYRSCGVNQDVFLNNELLLGAFGGTHWRERISFDMGDVDGDLKADLVALEWPLNYRDGVYERVGNNPEIAVYSYTGAGGRVGYFDWSYNRIKDFPDEVVLCLPNVDNDSFVLKYLAHDILLTSPVIEAVIASPPYWEDANNGEGGTSYGRSSGQSTSTGLSQGSTMGLSVGMEFECDFLGLGFSFKASVEESITWGASASLEITESFAYNTGLGEDKVVFTAIPYDVYYYEVVVAPPNSSSISTDAKVGDKMTVSIPRRPGTYHGTVDWFNQSNGDFTDVIVPYTKGDPLSYERSSGISARKAASIGADGNPRGLFTSITNMTAGRSDTGSSSQSVEMVNASEKSLDYELSQGIEIEGKVAGITAGMSVSFEYGYNVTSSVSSGISIEGEVPDIPTSLSNVEYLAKAFKWGLLMYPVKYGSADQEYNFITYWVDPAQ